MEQNLEVVKIEGVRGYVDGNQTVWLNAEDVARGLGFVQTKNGVEYPRYDRISAWLKERNFPHAVGKGDYIPENMFYRLAMKANNEAAKVFQAKVADEILPSIRKTGLYINPNAPIDPNFLRRMADELEAKNKIIAEQERVIAELKPEADYCRSILESKGGVSITIIAKDYGQSAAAFNQLLAKYKIQYRCGNAWVIREPYSKMGYTESETLTLQNGLAVVRTKWTQKGRMYLYNMLKRHGIFPVCEREEPMAVLF